MRDFFKSLTYLFFIMPKEIITINFIYWLIVFLNVKAWFTGSREFHRLLMDISVTNLDEVDNE